MSVNIIGLIFIPLMIILTIKCNLKNLFMISFILSTFTATGIVSLNLIDFTITIPQFCALMLCIKILNQLVNKKIKFQGEFSYLLLFFVLYAGVTLLYPIIWSKGIVVLTPDDLYLPIEFKFQIITQYAYLFLGFIVYLGTCIICQNIVFKKDDFILVSRIILWIFLALLLLQLILPLELYNNLFRDISSSNNQTVNGIIRLTGPTYESSILALTCTPFIGVLLLNLNLKNIKYDIPLIIFSILLLSTTKSSTFLISLIILLIFFVIKWIPYMYTYMEKISFLKKIVICSLVLILIITIVLLGKDSFFILIEKLQGKGTSGSLRLEAFKHHLKVFKLHPILGVGFGTIRSYDLFSTWLSSLGILGLGSFLLYVLNLFIKNYKIKSDMIYFQFIIILLINLFISVPEPYYLFIWIALGIFQSKLYIFDKTMN